MLKDSTNRLYDPPQVVSGGGGGGGEGGSNADRLGGRAKESESDGIVDFKDVSSSSIINTHWKRADSWCQ